MTTPIKTQCPHCQACSNVKQTQLNKVNATVSCEQCQRSFLVNKHLIVSSNIGTDAATVHTDKKIAASDTSFETSIDSTPPKAPPTKDFLADTLIHDDLIHDDLIHDDLIHDDLIHDDLIHDDLIHDDLIHDDLIHDDMDIDEPEDADLEYDSLDNMEAWLTQASLSTASTSSLSEDRATTTKKTPASLIKPSFHTTTDDFSSAQVALSSAAANDIHASVGDTTDNSWLEDLLKEQNTSQNTGQDDKDLSQLLLEMGVPTKDERNDSKGQIKKSQSDFTSTPERRSVASMLWTMGCLVLGLLLFAQYIIFNLETLVKNPAHAERLQAICTLAACSLPSADLTAFTVTDTSHKSSQINKNVQSSDISATLNNQSATAQLYPHIKVSVYGANNLIGAFIAAPNDYLLSKQNQLAANRGRKLLFTIPVANKEIREVSIEPIY